MIVDRRCPACDRPVRGREAVVSVKGLAADRKVRNCPRCSLEIRLGDEPDDLGAYSFESVGLMPWERGGSPKKGIAPLSPFGPFGRPQ